MISAAVLCTLLILLKALIRLVYFPTSASSGYRPPFLCFFNHNCWQCSHKMPVQEIQHSQRLRAFCGACFFLYLDIYRLPPEVLMGLIPGGLILPQYWDFSQSWYWEGWSRMSPVAARLLLTRAIWVDGRITACRPCGLGAEAGVQQLRVMKKLN